MARAFIASVPLGIVLVAALVVPLLVIPGTFGFQGWPTSAPSTVTDRAVRLEAVAPGAVAVAVDKRPRRVAPVTHRAFASATPAPHKPAAASLSARAAQTPQGRAVALVQPSLQHQGAVQPQPQPQPQPPAHHSPSAPSAPSAPAAPAPQPTVPAPAQPAPQQIATEAAPVARSDAPPEPDPAPPVQTLQQSPPQDRGQDGNGDGEHHGHGLALGHLLGHGHGCGHGDD